MKKIGLMIVVVLLMTGHVFAAQKITFTKHPDLKLGFTTANYAKCKMGPTLANAKAWIDYAAQQGYLWVELRDPNADLTLEDCKEIAAYARAKKIEIVYATNRGPNDVDYWQVLEKASQRTLLFENGLCTIRTTDAGTDFRKDAKKTTWTADEFKKALDTQNKAARMLDKKGMHLMVENAFLSLFGPFSLDEFFSAADPAIGFQLDTANLFAVARIKPEPKDAEAFLKKHIKRVRYTHLKSSVNKVQHPVLADNPLPFATVFQLLAEHKKPYIAIELGMVDRCDLQQANLEKSLDYLKDKGFITINP